MPQYTFNVFAPGSVDINGSATTDFRLAYSNGSTLQLNSSGITQMTVTDDDAFLSGDTPNEQSSDQSQQTSDILGPTENVYMDYTYTVADSAGNTYTIYVIDVRDSPLPFMSTNLAVTYIGYDPSNPPPFDEPLTILGFDAADVQTPYSTLICFCAGTRIRTPTGGAKVENLHPGMLVETLDNGPKKILWVGHRQLSALDLLLKPQLRPVLIRAHTLRKNVPVRDTYVSQQHRIMLKHHGLQLLFGEPRYLAAARTLVDDEWISISDTKGGAFIDYYHILLDTHEVLFANNMPADSLFLGNQAISSFTDEAQQEIATLFPNAGDLGVIHDKTALPVLRRFEVTAWRTWLLDPSSAGSAAQN